MSAQDEDKPTYKIGLVMAGAVSAGAYATGVIDVLIEALDEWHWARAERPGEVPDHDVPLKGIAGRCTSAALLANVRLIRDETTFADLQRSTLVLSREY